MRKLALMDSLIKQLVTRADILCFHFADGEVEELLEAGDGVVVELGGEGRIMGVEVWGASKRGVIEELKRVVAAAQARSGERAEHAR